MCLNTYTDKGKEIYVMNLTSVLEDFQNFSPFAVNYSISTESSGTTSDESSSVNSSLTSSPNYNSFASTFKTCQIPAQFGAKNSRQRYRSNLKKSSEKAKVNEKRCPKLKINLKKGQSVLIEPEEELPKSYSVTSNNSNLKSEKLQRKLLKKWTIKNFQPTIAEKVKLRKRSCRSDINSEFNLEVDDSHWPLEIYDQQQLHPNCLLNDFQIDNKHTVELINAKQLVNSFPVKNEMLPPELMFIAKDLMSDFVNTVDINQVKIKDEPCSPTSASSNSPVENSVIGCVTDAIQSILGDTFNEEDEYHDAKEGICQLLQNGVLKDKMNFPTLDSLHDANSITSLSASEEKVPLEIVFSDLSESFQDTETVATVLQTASNNSNIFEVPIDELELDVASYVVISGSESQSTETTQSVTESLISITKPDTLVSSQQTSAANQIPSLVKLQEANDTTISTDILIDPDVLNCMSRKKLAYLPLEKRSDIRVVDAETSKIPVSTQIFKNAKFQSKESCVKDRNKFERIGSGAVFSSILNKDITVILDSLVIPSSFEIIDEYTQLDERVRHSSSSRNSSANTRELAKYSSSPITDETNKSSPSINTEYIKTPRPLKYLDYTKKSSNDHAYKRKQKEVVYNKNSVANSENSLKRKLPEVPNKKKVKSVFNLPFSSPTPKNKTLQKRDSNQYNQQVNARKKESYLPKEEQRNKAMKERRVVYVGEIPPSYTIQQLRERFSIFGPIENIQIKSKDCDTKDKHDHEYLHSPNNKLRSQSLGIWSTKQENKNFFGFITYQTHSDATKAIEKGNEGYASPVFTLNFGGRRQFVKEDYRDLDAKADQGLKMQAQTKMDDDFASLLAQEKRRLGL